MSLHPLKIITKIEDGIILLATISVVTIISVSAAARYFFSYNLAGAEEILGISGAWMFFSGAVRASRQREQISANMISSFIKSPRVYLFFATLRNLFSVVICAIFAFWSIEFLVWEIHNGGHTPALGIPIFIGKLSLALSCFGMTAYALRDLISDIRNYKE